ncbi:MAG: peptide chain release factor-like protein [Planctomycetia bacterium]|nr:MAG: peptide chain release factor-like protein [Planctomycetia bacterium]RIK70755.1 MAG: peptide chain release factor-like protein [Planctomycetota bacterium]
MTRSHRNAILTASDAQLLAQCEVDTYRASGPGGQKRNKTSSAVRLRHLETGQLVIAEESRSQHDNKARALRRLRLALALRLRCEISTDNASDHVKSFLTAAGRIEINPRNDQYALVVADVLDFVAEASGQVREAARQLGMTTSQLSRFLASDGKILHAVNELRKKAGLSPLKPPAD